MRHSADYGRRERQRFSSEGVRFSDMKSPVRDHNGHLHRSSDGHSYGPESGHSRYSSEDHEYHRRDKSQDYHRKSEEQDNYRRKEDREYHRRTEEQSHQNRKNDKDYHHKRTENGDHHRRYYSGDYSNGINKERSHGRYDRNREERKSSRRSQSMGEPEDYEHEHNRRNSVKEKKSTPYYGKEDRSNGIKHTASRSKSHDSEVRRSSREKRNSEKREDNRLKSIEEDPNECYHTPFYLHSGPTTSSHSSSQNGYERIQSLFYESTEKLDHQVSSKSKQRDASPRKRHESHTSSDRNNNNSNRNLNTHKSRNERNKSPKRRAAPAMPLPEPGGWNLRCCFGFKFSILCSFF